MRERIEGQLPKTHRENLLAQIEMGDIQLTRYQAQKQSLLQQVRLLDGQMENIAANNARLLANVGDLGEISFKPRITP